MSGSAHPWGESSSLQQVAESATAFAVVNPIDHTQYCVLPEFIMDWKLIIKSIMVLI